jgi:hypothetical protein
MRYNPGVMFSHVDRMRGKQRAYTIRISGGDAFCYLTVSLETIIGVEWRSRSGGPLLGTVRENLNATQKRHGQGLKSYHYPAGSEQDLGNALAGQMRVLGLSALGSQWADNHSNTEIEYVSTNIRDLIEFRKATDRDTRAYVLRLGSDGWRGTVMWVYISYDTVIGVELHSGNEEAIQVRLDKVSQTTGRHINEMNLRGFKVVGRDDIEGVVKRGLIEIGLELLGPQWVAHAPNKTEVA